MRRLPLLLAVALIVLTGSATRAQQDVCRVPAPAPSRDPNIFSAAQENDLGDAIADRFESSLRLIEDEALTAHLQSMGQRLVRHLPPTGLRISFHLVDLPEANAFVLPGGRVYVSRKLIAFSESEDELANVLGHELGHLVARQQTIAMTKRLKEVLGVTEVGDRADILAKYNKLMDNAARKPGADDDRSHGRDQLEADRIGAIVVAAAGYDPNAHVAIYDRISETKGKTGSALSRFFGTTSPESKRLGELIKGVAALPAACSQAPVQNDVFQAWRLSVISATATTRKESLQGKVGETKLASFRGEISHLRFSPDGRYLLAQDSAGISVLTRDPLALVFQIGTPDAMPAHFTPGSDAIVLHTRDLRVERWSVADRKLAEAREVFRQNGCTSSALSPDGRILACNDDKELALVDVASGLAIFQRKDFYKVSLNELFLSMLAAMANGRIGGGLRLQFSPDSRFFVAAFRGYENSGVLAYDLSAKTVLSLKADVRKLLMSSFAFVGPDQLIGLDPEQHDKSGAFTLTGGTVTERFSIPVSQIEAATQANVLFVRPYLKHAVGVFDLKTRTVTKTADTEAIDAHGSAYAAERGTGDLAIFALEGNEVRASVNLPAMALPRVQAGAVSPDFRWVAISEGRRGVLWNAGTGERVGPIRAFDGAFLDQAGLLFADMPSAAGEPRSITRLNGPSRQISRVLDIPAERSMRAEQFGRWVLVMRGLPLNTLVQEGVEIELRDLTRRPEPVWKAPYAKHPPHHIYGHAASDAVVLTWHAEMPEGRERIRINPELRSTAKLGDIEGDHIIEVLDAATGAVRKRMLLETGKGSFDILNVIVSGDTMFVMDTLGRVLVYTLSTGELRGHAFGHDPVFNIQAGVLVVGGGGGRLVVYDLATMARRTELKFAQDVPLKALSPDGQQLFVLTADQTAHILMVNK